MKYRVILHPKISKNLKKNFDNEERLKIIKVIIQLGNDPRKRQSIKMSGYQDRYRLRIGDVRVLYRINDQLKKVSVEVVDRRGSSTLY